MGSATTVTSARAGTSPAAVYSNIQANSARENGGADAGFGWCTGAACAGGSGMASQQTFWTQQPSLDGGSTRFQIRGPAGSDGLWWFKLGPNDALSSFQFDFWLNVSPEAATYSQALEFDAFQFLSPRRYMFGTQCDYLNGYSHGVWDVWNESAGQWHWTGLACPAFVPGDWYHLTWSVSRSTDQNEHYNSIVVEHYDSSGTKQLDSTTTPVNVTLPSGPLPDGWSNNVGVQFQLDLNAAAGNADPSYTTLVDKVTLTAW